ncbi:MAG: hypothetical protein Q7S47_00885 [bacterium]|nr:hypothetical protein [bacterium]
MENERQLKARNLFLENDTLPVDVRCTTGYDAKAILEAWGIKFFGAVEGDPLFQYVELPSGWRKIAAPDSLYSLLVDNKSRKRADVFYRAGGNRETHLYLRARFSILRDFSLQEKEHLIATRVMGCGRIIHTSGPFEILNPDIITSNDIQDQADARAVSWLKENYPYWRNPGAYWD